MVMEDESDAALAQGLLLPRDGEFDTAIAVKLLAGWVLTGEHCEVCFTQLVCNRLRQTYCVACLEWKKTALNNNTDSKHKSEITAEDDDDDDKTPASLKLIKSHIARSRSSTSSSTSSSVVTGGNRGKDLPDSPRPRTTLQQHLFCTVPLIADDEESGLINAALWEDSDSRSCCRKQQDLKDLKDPKQQYGEGLSPRTVLEGPESSTSGWSEFNSPKKRGPLHFGEDGAVSGFLQPSQKHCMQSLWRSFAVKKWQSFPSSYRKKELLISDPVLLQSSPRSSSSTRIDSHGGAICPEGECADEMLSVSCSARRSWQTFSYQELSLATRNFDSENLVGKGGYAKVFRGVLEDGRLIAVKKHSRGDTPAEKERDFLIELGIVSHVSHINVAKLLGICIENGLHLVFQFSTLGSLQPLLHAPMNSPVLSWEARMKVAVGVARGLRYLHEQCQRRIIHRDIKASNILLDSNYEPQISDFGLSKWLPDRWTHHAVSPIEGTFGYLAPEYFMHGIVDEKTDVYAYGVLLLELVTGRRPVDSEKQNLVVWAKPFLTTSNIKQLVDRRLEGVFAVDQMNRVVLTAGLCVRRSAPWRPTMGQVVQLLSEDAVEKKSEHLARLVSKSHDFTFSDTESQEEGYGYTDDYESDMQRHRALALEGE